jgi:hypothetical protein
MVKRVGGNYHLGAVRVTMKAAAFSLVIWEMMRGLKKELL